jgi:hypothetical protein
MNQFPQRAVIGPVAIDRVKTAKAAAAQSAAAFGIQWKAILKWCPATYAEEFGAEGLRFLQTPAADRDTGDLP